MNLIVERIKKIRQERKSGGYYRLDDNFFNLKEKSIIKLPFCLILIASSLYFTNLEIIVANNFFDDSKEISNLISDLLIFKSNLINNNFFYLNILNNISFLYGWEFSRHHRKKRLKALIELKDNKFIVTNRYKQLVFFAILIQFALERNILLFLPLIITFNTFQMISNSLLWWDITCNSVKNKEKIEITSILDWYRNISQKLLVYKDTSALNSFIEQTPDTLRRFLKNERTERFIAGFLEYWPSPIVNLTVSSLLTTRINAFSFPTINDRNDFKFRPLVLENVMLLLSIVQNNLLLWSFSKSKYTIYSLFEFSMGAILKSYRNESFNQDHWKRIFRNVPFLKTFLRNKIVIPFVTVIMIIFGWVFMINQNAEVNQKALMKKILLIINRYRISLVVFAICLWSIVFITLWIIWFKKR